MQENKKIISWWSGGVTSAVACKLAIEKFGVENVRIVFIDTRNEDEDTYRFMKDCESWYSSKIETISSSVFYTIQSVWFSYLRLNTGTGAICSSTLKRLVRLKFQEDLNFDHQVFGFSIEETRRANRLEKNNDDTKPIFPLIENSLTKFDCIGIISKASIEIPNMYKRGFDNNNCWKTGCIQAGSGYWKKMQAEYPEKFDAMASVEHQLTNLKGTPVTILKKRYAKEDATNAFLKKHPDYPDLPTIDDMSSKPMKLRLDCSGFCGTEDEGAGSDLALLDDDSDFVFEIIEDKINKREPKVKDERSERTRKENYFSFESD